MTNHDELFTQLFIAGTWEDASDGGTFAVEDPHDGSVITQVASATTADAQRAFDAACAAQSTWAATPPAQRADILWNSYKELMARKDEFGELMTWELGRALPDSVAESVYGANFFRWFAGEAERMAGDYRIAPAGNARLLEVQQPVGPVLAVTPWNFPLSMGTRKLGAAFAAGCTVVWKPASKTPLTALALADVLKRNGLPDGVLSVIPCSGGVTDVILEDPRLRKFTFTGSTEVGRALAAKVPLARTSLELGGNAPFVVLSDADVDVAAEAAQVAKMRGAGQVCIAANRFIVHTDLIEEFTEKVTAAMKEMEYGPLSGDDQVTVVKELVDSAVADGARIVWQDTVPTTGSWYPLTVLDNIPMTSDIWSHEIFGPVVAIYPAHSDEEAIAMANDTEFGLAAYVFSENLQNALTAAERIEAGMVAVNKGALSDPAAPFGGVKNSGIGREGGFEGIDEYLEHKFIALPR